MLERSQGKSRRILAIILRRRYGAGALPGDPDVPYPTGDPDVIYAPGPPGESEAEPAKDHDVGQG